MVEELLRDFAAELMDPYKYMDSDQTPASQMAVARKKVTDEYARRLKVWCQFQIDEAAQEAYGKGLFKNQRLHKYNAGDVCKNCRAPGDCGMETCERYKFWLTNQSKPNKEKE